MLQVGEAQLTMRSQNSDSETNAVGDLAAGRRITFRHIAYDKYKTTQASCEQQPIVRFPLGQSQQYRRIPSMLSLFDARFKKIQEISVHDASFAMHASFIVPG